MMTPDASAPPVPGGALDGAPCRDGDWTWWPAPAKVNRFLRIVGRRADGYHELETLFQFIDWCDWVAVRPRDDTRFRLEGGVDGEHDLCLRAARWAASQAERDGACRWFGVDLRLVKRLPTGAGLGGGSSDAATVLTALHVLWNVPTPLSSWTRAAVALGADVPVFVDGRASFARGLGERLQSVEPDTPRVLVVVPPDPCSTAELYAAPDLVRDAPARGWSAYEARRLAQRAGLPPYDNAFEPIAARRPVIARVLHGARQAGLRSHLTGSGSACVVYLPDGWTGARALAAMGVGEAEMPTWCGVLRNRSALWDARRRAASRA